MSFTTLLLDEVGTSAMQHESQDIFFDTLQMIEHKKLEGCKRVGHYNIFFDKREGIIYVDDLKQWMYYSVNVTTSNIDFAHRAIYSSNDADRLPYVVNQCHDWIHIRLTDGHDVRSFVLREREGDKFDRICLKACYLTYSLEKETLQLKKEASLEEVASLIQRRNCTKCGAGLQE